MRNRTPAAVEADAFQWLAELPFHACLEKEAATLAANKGERTRARLIAAAAYHLESDGFVALRVTDICRRAGISQGAFYLYFKNKTEIAVSVLSKFNERSLGLMRTEGPRSTAWEAIRSSIALITRIYRLNPGLMRCLWQVNDETPEFGEILRRSNIIWMRTVSRSIVRRAEMDDSVGSLPLVVTYAMASMVDHFLVQLYVTCDPQLSELVADEAAAVEVLSALWYRAVWRANPPDGALSYAAAIEKFVLKEQNSD